jgi:hypothetical protein
MFLLKRLLNLFGGKEAVAVSGGGYEFIDRNN